MKQRPERAVGICPRFSKSKPFRLALQLYLSNRKLKKCLITKFGFLWYQNEILNFYKTLESITKWYKKVLALVLLNLIELRALKTAVEMTYQMKDTLSQEAVRVFISRNLLVDTLVVKSYLKFFLSISLWHRI